MSTPILSVIIPARNEIYLEKTIRNVLENAQGEIEVIAELDGYLPDPVIDMNDDRVTFIHHKESIGQRACINHAASIAKGKYIMKLDAHCAVGPGFDVILERDHQPEWTVIPRMYNLDIKTWLPKLHKKTDYMYFTSPEHPEKPFRAMYYEGRDYRDWHNRSEMIDDTMCCMGPGWFMEKERFIAQGGCDEGHTGGWGQQGIEVALKAWLSGGALKVNKNTWFAHWFRGGDTGPGFPYSISGKQIETARDYSKNLWLKDQWPLATRKLSWLIEKFSPPSWNLDHSFDEEKKRELYLTFYKKIIKPGNNFIRWRGFPCLKFPTDIALYQEVIFDKKPDFIIETGTKYGGSAMFFGDMCELNGKGHVISVDLYSEHNPAHSRVTYLKGSSIDKGIIEKIKGIVGNGSVMVILDSDHAYRHVKWELFRYSNIVTPGQFMVVEDCYNKFSQDWGPKAARDWFLKRTKRFKMVDVSKKFLVGMTMDGWLLKQ